jgi:biopolymer transport protein ExbB
MENTGKLEINKLEKNMGILMLIGRIAPILGFVGTIIGVIKIFYDISLTDNISIGVISGGLYQKMITSASGLIIGLTAFIAYFLINSMIDKAINRMESSSVEFMDILHEPAA